MSDAWFSNVEILLDGKPVLLADPEGKLNDMLDLYCPQATDGNDRSSYSGLYVLNNQSCPHPLGNLPLDNLSPRPQMKVGDIYYPLSPTAWMVGYLLVNGADWFDLYQKRNEFVSLSIKSIDGDGKQSTHSINVKIVSSQTIGETFDIGKRDENEVFVITVVDERYFWQTTAMSIGEWPETAQWSTLTDSIDAALTTAGLNTIFGNVSSYITSAEANFGYPDSIQLYRPGQPVGPLIKAVCDSLCIPYALITAPWRNQTEWPGDTTGEIPGVFDTRIQVDEYRAPATPFIDYHQYFPKNFIVIFPKMVDNEPGCGETSYTKTATTTTEYGGVNNTAPYPIYSSYYAKFTGTDTTPTNEANLITIAQSLADGIYNAYAGIYGVEYWHFSFRFDNPRKQYRCQVSSKYFEIHQIRNTHFAQSDPDKRNECCDSQELVYIRNTSESTVPQYGILEINHIENAGGTLPTDLIGTIFWGSTPTFSTYSKRLAVVLEECAAGAVVPCRITGHVPVKVYSEFQTTPRFAHIARSSPTQRLEALHNENNLGFPILWRENGTGEKWAIIDLKYHDEPGWVGLYGNGMIPGFQTSVSQPNVTGQCWLGPQNVAGTYKFAKNSTANVVNYDNGLRFDGPSTWRGVLAGHFVALLQSQRVTLGELEFSVVQPMYVILKLRHTSDVSDDNNLISRPAEFDLHSTGMLQLPLDPSATHQSRHHFCLPFILQTRPGLQVSRLSLHVELWAHNNKPGRDGGKISINDFCLTMNEVAPWEFSPSSGGGGGGPGGPGGGGPGQAIVQVLQSVDIYGDPASVVDTENIRITTSRGLLSPDSGADTEMV